jgi:hypothetical protein
MEQGIGGHVAGGGRSGADPDPIIGFLLSIVIFGGAITADIVGGILLIAIGLVLTLRR